MVILGEEGGAWLPRWFYFLDEVIMIVQLVMCAVFKIGRLVINNEADAQRQLFSYIRKIRSSVWTTL